MNIDQKVDRYKGKRNSGAGMEQITSKVNRSKTSDNLRKGIHAWCK